MASKHPKYYLVEADALPEVFVKVTEAKALLETGAAKTVAEAVDKVDLSRSAFYKYKDAVKPFRDLSRDTIMTFHITLHDKPGTLAAVLSIFPESGANILTINQSIPANGVALVTISVVTGQMAITSDDLLSNLREVNGVISVDIMAG